MKIQGSFSYTYGQQGGIGYPPEVAKISNRWYLVEDSRNHGGTICYKCSETRNVKYGFTPQNFGQPKPFGSECYRNLVPSLKPSNLPLLNNLPIITWQEYANLIKDQFGEPNILT